MQFGWLIVIHWANIIVLREWELQEGIINFLLFSRTFSVANILKHVFSSLQRRMNCKIYRERITRWEKSQVEMVIDWFPDHTRGGLIIAMRFAWPCNLQFCKRRRRLAPSTEREPSASLFQSYNNKNARRKLHVLLITFCGVKNGFSWKEVSLASLWKDYWCSWTAWKKRRRRWKSDNAFSR